jgi:hypothetical protein
MGPPACFWDDLTLAEDSTSVIQKTEDPRQETGRLKSGRYHWINDLAVGQDHNQEASSDRQNWVVQCVHLP